MKNVDFLKDLCVMRSSDGSYTEHCHMLVEKAVKIPGAIRYTFHCERHDLM